MSKLPEDEGSVEDENEDESLLTLLNRKILSELWVYYGHSYPSYTDNFYFEMTYRRTDDDVPVKEPVPPDGVVFPSLGRIHQELPHLGMEYVTQIRKAIGLETVRSYLPPREFTIKDLANLETICYFNLDTGEHENLLQWYRLDAPYVWPVYYTTPINWYDVQWSFANTHEIRVFESVPHADGTNEIGRPEVRVEIPTEIQRITGYDKVCRFYDVLSLWHYLRELLRIIDEREARINDE